MKRTFFWMTFVPDRWVNGLATCGPLGYWGKAPGTIGSVVGIALYTVIFHSLALIPSILILSILAYLSILICDEAERRLRLKDPGEMILDEIIAVPIVFLGLQPKMSETGHVWIYMIAGFALFRLFDIAKPFGISKLQNLPGGLGVVVDDLAAAALSCACLHLGLYLWDHSLSSML